MAQNTGKGHRKGLIKDRFQKKNTRTGLWDKYDRRGNYVSTKKTGGRWKSIIEVFGRGSKRK